MLVICLSISACRRSKSPSYDSEWLAPLAYANLTVNNLLPDSISFVNPDHTIDIRYHQNLYHKTVNELLKLPDTGISSTMALKDMTLSDNTIVHTLSLGQICEQGGVAGATVIANHGSMLAIPAISTTNANSTTVDLGSLFKSAQILEGEMEIDLTNNFPVDLQDFVFQLNNKSDNSLVAQDTFKLIKSNGGKVVHSISLAGKKVEGLMVGTVLNLYSPGSGSTQVLIDTAKASVFKISIRNLKVSSITAIFPNRKLIDFNYGFNFKLNDAQLKNIEFDTAFIDFSAYSTFPENLKLDLVFPQTSKNASLYNLPFTVSKGNYPFETKSTANIDWSGYKLDLTGPDKMQTNYLTIHVSASADSTGIPVTITSNDYIKFTLKFKQLSIKKGDGYFGQQKFVIEKKEPQFNLFKRITAGKFYLGSLKTSLMVENSIGASAQITFDKLEFYKNDTQKLTGSIFSKPFSIGRGIYFPNAPVRSVFDITEANSNITSIIQSMPTGYHVKATATTNPNGNVYNFGDFFYGNSYIKADLNVQMPVQLIAQGLQLADTIKYDFPHLDQGRKVKEVLLRITAENAFPVEAKVNIYVLGSDKKPIDSFFTTTTYIAAGAYNTSNPAYCNPTKSILEQFANVDELVRLKQGYYIVINAWINTKKGNGTFYDTYFLDVKIAADVLYETKL
ncbi:MAG: hypothetical protein SGJ10_12040 [Bacteroidota bacterium]|nr:hypothetical protein [Bacteroidota bacterium]